MSRLDDELKVAFQRQEPSPDFAARVLARINEAPAAPVRPSLWQRLSEMLVMPAWRYAAVGAVAVLLILVGLIQASPPAKAAGTDVDLALVLLVDISGSMDTQEQLIQRDGYVGAFEV